MATKTLSEFIENYIKNLNISGTPLSFEDYKVTLGPSFENTYYRTMKSALAKRQADKGIYGSSSSALKDAGLSRSGYRDHLSRLADDKYKSTVLSLDEQRQAKDDEAAAGYTNYLENYARSEKKLRNTVREQLLSKGIINSETAYRYALESGLSEKDARAVSESAYSLARQKVINDVMKQIVSLQLDERTTAMVAKEAGLNNADVLHLSELAKEYFEYLNSLPGDYQGTLEDIENLANNKYWNGE